MTSLLNTLNFSGGPGALPQQVLAEAQQAIGEVPGVGLSILGISHRSDWFREVVAETEANILALLGLSPAEYLVLFMQGGASLQFSMVPMLLLRGKSAAAEYLHTGYWSGKAIPEARREGQVRILWSGAENGFTRLPADEELTFGSDAAYLHYVSNETVEGLQFQRILGRDDVPRVCDMSSDFLSRPCAPEHFAFIYAHAQKNLGPAGVTVVVMRRSLLETVPAGLHTVLDYRRHAEAHSIYNTPPVFAIYVVMLVTRWLRDEIGGLENMAATNERKANLLYQTLDGSTGFYRGHAAPADRSNMNVAFRLETPKLEAEFLRQAYQEGFRGLKGHRSLGGIRASIYNAVTLQAVATLAGFMEDFQSRHHS